MAVTIVIPTPLRQYADKQAQVVIEAKTVGEALDALTTKYRELRRHLYAEDGTLRNFVNVYLNDEDVRHIAKDETLVKEGDTIMIVPSVAGGNGAGADRAQRSPVDGDKVETTRLSNDEIRRYSRHLIMPEVGLEGQRRLKAASVLIVGAGGLGSPAALYLAAAGVGRIGIVDFDVVDESNLQRQVLFTTADVGKSKAETAKARLLVLNPNIEVDVHRERLTSENALSILRDYDVIADGTDNFPTRYLVNDACVLLGKPNAYASIFRFEGQASVFWAEKGPCYRCLYPEPPPPGLVPSCAEGGVLGVLPGVVGVIQAIEVIKLILGSGEPLIGRLLLFDALDMRFRELKLRKNPECKVCGPRSTVKNLIDYDEFCGVRGEETGGEAVDAGNMITVGELKSMLDAKKAVFILDVRNPEEFEICRLSGSKLIPLPELPRRANELSTADEIVVHCHHGIRSAQAVNFLKTLGFKKIKNLAGGIDAWSKQVDPTVPRY
ncbi:MAG: molybdopterin-synthase adenylyltransferase MoeB [Euryarchaeota archaeon]|nr:molybdopterin-synthase adenylyltransferase MoeB [Euryarchaeota archaeon]